MEISMKTIACLFLLGASVSASAITPLSDKEYEEKVNAFQIMPQGACEVSEDGFDTFLEYFVRNPKLAAHFTAPSATQPFYLGLRDYTWVYGSADNEFENPSAVLTQTMDKKASKVSLSIQKGEYDADYKLVRRWGDVSSYDFVFSGGCWKRVR